MRSVSLPMPVFVMLDVVVMLGELGVGSSEAAEADTAVQVEIDTSVKNIESATDGGQDVGKGSLYVVKIAWMHAAGGGSVWCSSNFF